jgi:copper chaperone CopZ
VFLAHDIPGRFRVRIPAIKGEQGSAAEIEARLRQVPGVRTVLANPITGSVLVEYQPPATSMRGVLQSSGLLETAAGEIRSAVPAARHVKPALGERALAAACECLVELAIKAAATALI